MPLVVLAWHSGGERDVIRSWETQQRTCAAPRLRAAAFFSSSSAAASRARRADRR